MWDAFSTVVLCTWRSGFTAARRYMTMNNSLGIVHCQFQNWACGRQHGLTLEFCRSSTSKVIEIKFWGFVWKELTSTCWWINVALGLLYGHTHTLTQTHPCMHTNTHTYQNNTYILTNSASNIKSLHKKKTYFKAFHDLSLCSTNQKSCPSSCKVTIDLCVPLGEVWMIICRQ